MSKRALVVEDDANIAELLRLYLGKDGFDVMIAADGGKAESSFDLFSPDVVLLDIMLPVKDGWQICRDIRKKSSVPIIMLTAKGETADKINGLDMGADDYVTKPFDVKELLARVHAVMRRTDADAPVEKKLTFDKLVINLESYELIVDGVKIDTPPKEMELLYHLAASPNRVFTRNQLLAKATTIQGFLNAKTSTISGIKKTYTQAQDTFNKKKGTDFSKNEYFQLVTHDKWKQACDRFGSDQIISIAIKYSFNTAIKILDNLDTFRTIKQMNEYAENLIINPKFESDYMNENPFE